MKVFWLAVLTAVLWGFAPVFDKLGLGKATPTAALSIRTLVVALGLLVFIALSGGWRQQFSGLDRHSVMCIVLGGLAAGFLGQLVYYFALKAGEPTRVVPIAASYPLIAALLSTLFLKEPVTPGKVIGAILIFLGILAIGMDQIFWPR